jgi:hypothetical protein
VQTGTVDRAAKGAPSSYSTQGRLEKPIRRIVGKVGEGVRRRQRQLAGYCRRAGRYGGIVRSVTPGLRLLTIVQRCPILFPSNLLLKNRRLLNPRYSPQYDASLAVEN